METTEKRIWTNKQGQLVHEDLVRVDEKLKTELVESILSKVSAKQTELLALKKEIQSDIMGYLSLLRDEYGLEQKSNKGNLTLQDFSGLAKVQIAVAEHIEFDEKLTFAKEKIDIYLKEITDGASADLKTLVLRVFEVDKKGNVNAKQVLSLKQYDIKHPLWLEAMALIDDAVEVVGSKSYIRFYKRASIEDAWQNVTLDFAGV